MTIPIILAVIVFAVFFYFGYQKEKKPEQEIYKPVIPDMEPMELQMLSLLNFYRKASGRNTLTPDKLCRDIAEYHLKYMIEMGKASHDYYPERASELILHGVKAVGECSADLYRTAQGFINGYVKSPEHQPILVGNFTHIGIRIMQDKDGKNYNVLIFIRI